MPDVPPPNPYDNWPPVGSTVEELFTDWAVLTADWLARRERWLRSEEQE